MAVFTSMLYCLILTSVMKAEMTFNTVRQENFLPFPVKLVSADIERSTGGYLAYTVRVFAPKDSLFQCISDRFQIAVSSDAEHFQKPYPKVTEEGNGLFKVTCFKKKIAEEFDYLRFRCYSNGACLDINFNTSTTGVGTKENFENLTVMYHSQKTDNLNGKCLTKTEFRMNKGGIHMDVTKASGVAFIESIRGSEKTVDYSFFIGNRAGDINGNNNIGNLTSTVRRDKKLTVNTLEMNKSEIEHISGSILMSVGRKVESVLQSVRFYTRVDEESSCISPFKKGQLAISTTDSRQLREGQFGSVYCSATGNPLPSVSIYKVGSGSRNKENTMTFIDQFLTMVSAYVVWNVTELGDAGKYRCEAISGQKTVQSDFTVTVLSSYWITSQTKVLSKDDSLVVIQLRAKTPNSPALQCVKQNWAFDRYIFVDRNFNAEPDVPKSMPRNTTAGRSNPLDSYLRYYDPMVIGYCALNEIVDGYHLTNVLITLNLTKTEYPPRYLLCDVSDGNRFDQITVPVA